jgi:hypothetical protein
MKQLSLADWQEDTPHTTPDDKGFRFAPERSSHGIWLFFRFSLAQLSALAFSLIAAHGQPRQHSLRAGK